MSLVAEDAQPYPYAKLRYSTLLPAGKSVDAVLTPTSAGSLALFDRSLRTTNGASGGQLVVKLAIGTADGAPVAVADSYPLAEDGSLDTVAAGQPSVLANDTGATGVELVSTTQAGTLTLNADGSFVYAPKANFTGTDFFTYRATAGTLRSNVVTVELKVSPVNDPPMAMADSYQTPPGIALEVMAPGVLANDHDPDGDALTAELVTGPSGGTLTLQLTGAFTYTPAAGTTSDSFTYRVSDGVVYSPPVTVSIAVVATNLPPVAADDFASTTLNSAVAINVLANDSDPDGTIDAGSVLIVGPPSMGGSASVSNTGVVTYTPKPGFLGSESFSYTFKDSQGLVSSPATVLVNVVKP
jgi:hypothetical protein